MTDLQFRTALKSQYHAALAMLRDAIARCPPDAWTSTAHKKAFWQVAYHTLFFTHLYLQRDEAAFQLWAHHRGPDDGIGGAPYTQPEVLEYCDFCDRLIDVAVDALDLDSAESGFRWYGMSKLEHQLVNLRHIQHHGGQLADRLRFVADVGTRWVAARP
jgi:hypothetical protein